MPIIQKDVELYKSFQVSPIKFIRYMWGLTPQPLKPEFQNTAYALQDYKAEWFEPFVRGKHITWQEWTFLLAVEKALRGGAPKRLTVRSGRGTGKTATLSWLLLWWLFCFKDAQVPCTSPTSTQLHDMLWKEIAVWLDRMPEQIKNLYEWQSAYIRIKERPETWFARAKTAKKENPEALAGAHGEYVMLLVDEGCHDKDTEILTEQGFKFFEELEKNDRVLTMDEQTHIAHYEEIQTRIMMPYNGEMYYQNFRGRDFMITPDHDMYVAKKVKAGLNWNKRKPIDIKGMDVVKSTINWQGKYKETFKLGTFNSKRGKKDTKVFEMNDWLEFLGWYISEGSLLKRKISNGKMRYNGVQISQIDKNNRLAIDTLLTRMGLSFSENKKGFHISSIQLGMYLSRYGVGFDRKRVPRYVMELSPEQINIFLKTFMCGDGYMRKTVMILYTSGTGLANDLHELCLLAGYRTTKKTRNLKGQSQWILNHWATSTRDGYVITASPRTNFEIRDRKPLQKKHYKGMVYCVRVKSGLLFTRRNGYCMWSGNSGVPNQIYTVAEGSLTDVDFFFVIISNARRLTGYFYDTHHNDKANWQALHFNAEESPIVDWKFVNRIITKYGKDSDEYRVEVKGDFPLKGAMDEKKYFPLLNESDIRMGEDVGFVGEKRMGIDPAGAGQNKSEWGIRDNFRFKIVATEDISTPKSIAGKTITLMTAFEIKGKNTYLDNFGSGANVSQEIALSNIEEDKKKIKAVNLSDDADDKEKFRNKRAECYWRLREWLIRGGEVVRNQNLRDQLLSVKWRRLLSGQILIMSKEDMLKEQIPSPDKADAMALTFYKKQKEEKKPFKQRETQDPFAED